jgi:hypothetical protein
MTVSELRERLRKIAEEEQRQNLMGYSADGGAARHRLANSKAGVGVPVAGSNVPNNVVMEQTRDGRWIANGGRWGPFDTLRELEIAVYGRSELSAGKRDFRDEAPKPGE